MLTTQITNDREYRAVRVEAEQLAIEIAKQSERIQNLDPRLRLAMHGASSGRLQELRQRIAWYETLQRSGGSVVELASLESLPDLLVQARIACNLTQRELAERLGVSPQQVQKDEKGHYSKASLERLVKTAKVLGLEIRPVGILPSSAASAQAERLIESIRSPAGEVGEPQRARLAPAALKPYEAIGYELVDRKGEIIGEVSDLWVNGTTHRLEIVGFLAPNEPNVVHLVPAFSATAANNTLHLFYTKPAALAGPVIPRGAELTEEALNPLGDVFGPWASSTGHPVVHFSISEEGPVIRAAARLPLPEAPPPLHDIHQELGGVEVEDSPEILGQVSSEEVTSSVPDYADIQASGGIEVEVFSDEDAGVDRTIQR